MYKEIRFDTVNVLYILSKMIKFRLRHSIQYGQQVQRAIRYLLNVVVRASNTPLTFRPLRVAKLGFVRHGTRYAMQVIPDTHLAGHFIILCSYMNRIHIKFPILIHLH